MPPKLEALKVTAFRGATGTTELTFEGNAVCVVFGENGTGKSSLVDALDFVCNGKLGSLEFRRLGSGKRKEEYAIAVGRKEADVAISIQFGGTSWSATHSRQGARRCATPCRPQAWILRRAELLEFVEEEPAKRYQRLASVIALGEVEDSENALRQTVAEVDRSVQDALRASDQAKTALDQLWRAEGSPAGDYISWARAESAKSVEDLARTMQLSHASIEAIDHAIRTRQERTTAVSLKVAATSEQEESRKAWEAASAALVAGIGPLIEILGKAKEYLTQDALATVCPVCERGITAPTLTTRIDARLQQLHSAVQIKERADRAGAAMTRADEAFAKAEREWVATADLLLRTITDLNAAGGSTAVDFLLTAVGAVANALTDGQREAIAKLMASLRIAVIALRDGNQKTINQHNAITGNLQTFADKTTLLVKLSGVQARGAKALAIVEAARKDFVERLLQEVSADVDALYSGIHPGEPLGAVRMTLDAAQRGSLKFEAKFQSVAAVPPQAYFSESHLDTLGVCIFLALVRRYARPPSIVVLDDVFTSVDQTHLDRVASLIHEEAKTIGPMLITTHYRPWREIYRYSRAPGHQAQLVELLPWTVERGVRHTKTPLVLEDLRNAAATEPFDRQRLASQAGIVAESLLDHLTLLYECGMPRRPGAAYTLGDLLGGIDSKLAKALKITRKDGVPPVDQVIEVKPLLDQLASMTWIRNQVGCHFSLGGMDVANSQVIDFGNAVLALGDVLVCRKCGEMPRKNKSGVDRKCGCDVTKLVPATQPA